MMTEVSLTSSEQESDPFELAAPVSQRVQIRSIILEESHVRRTSHVNPKGKPVERNFSVKEIAFALRTNSRLLLVKVTFLLTVSEKENAKEERSVDDKSEAGEDRGVSQPFLFVEARFVLAYSLDSFDDLRDENFEAFASTNGLYNSWPYWREYVQNTVSRMGLPPITVPVFRF